MGVVNASLGGPVFSQLAYNAINRLKSVDILLVAAAGNMASNNDLNPNYPSDYNLPNLISVGATSWLLTSASYSNYGQSVDIFPPVAGLLFPL